LSTEESGDNDNPTTFPGCVRKDPIFAAFYVSTPIRLLAGYLSVLANGD